MSNTSKIITGVLVLVVIGFLVWSLTRPSPSGAPTGDQQTVLGTKTATSTIAIGESVVVNGMPIKVLALVEDSRCPSDVQCIQAGTVRVRASVGAASNEYTFTLGEPQQIGAVTVTLSSVLPDEKLSTETLQPSDYRFIFTVEAAAEGKG